MNTITNTNLQELHPGDWYCTPLHQLELSAKSAYYVTKTLIKLEEALGPIAP